MFFFKFKINRAGIPCLHRDHARESKGRMFTLMIRVSTTVVIKAGVTLGTQSLVTVSQPVRLGSGGLFDLGQVPYFSALQFPSAEGR